MKTVVKTAKPPVTVIKNNGKTTETITLNYGDKPEYVHNVDADTAQNNPLTLEIHELLDRFEIMYPEQTAFSDLRRAVIDRDLSSIFRLCVHDTDFRSAVIDDNLHSIFRLMETYPVTGHADDLRRAVLEQNLYSLFRLFPENNETVNLYRTAIVNKNIRSIFKILGSESEDLRKVIVDSNNWKIWPLLEQYTDTQFIAAFKSFYINNVTIDKDSFSRGQLQSKLWLIDELSKLQKDLGLVYLCAGWYATLATMLFESDISIKAIRSFDIDEQCRSVAETFNKPWVMDNWKFKASTKDINTIDFNKHTYEVLRSNGTVCELTDSPDTIINTSCEHIENFSTWYSKLPEGKLLVMQANNFVEIDEHINTYSNLTQFDTALPMSNVLYLGELKLEKYTRYMKIGYV